MYTQEPGPSTQWVRRQVIMNNIYIAKYINNNNTSYSVIIHVITRSTGIERKGKGRCENEKRRKGEENRSGILQDRVKEEACNIMMRKETPYMIHN